MVSVSCEKCGNNFRLVSKGSSRNVKSCSSCTKLFDDSSMDSFLDDFFGRSLL